MKTTISMNYFEFYNLPLQFAIDLSELKRKYIEVSKESHPDLHTLSSEDHQIQMLERSTLNNNAYNTLKDDQKRIKYILQLNQMIEDDEPYKMPADFLGEMMDMNEEVMELQMDFDLAKKTKVIDDLNRLVSKQNEQAQQWMNAFDSRHDTNSNLEKIKAHYFKVKYLNRLKENLDKLDE